MPIDVDAVVGASLGESTFSWSAEDLILYNLAVGSGVPAESDSELKYTYQNDLVAVPSFGTIPPFEMMMSVGAIEGLDITLAQILHGDQRLRVHRPIPASGTVAQLGRVTDVFDKGKGALLVAEVESRLVDSGELLFTNTAGIFLRGEGGFGGDRGPSRKLEREGDPDLVIETPTLPQQALLYRVASGDMNPLHADPEFAALVGYDRPILHGLCTYGVVCRAVVESALGGEPERVGSYSARFSGHVFPGETLVTQIWVREDEVSFRTGTSERGTLAITGGSIRPE